MNDCRTTCSVQVCALATFNSWWTHLQGGRLNWRPPSSMHVCKQNKLSELFIALQEQQLQVSGMDGPSEEQTTWGGAFHAILDYWSSKVLEPQCASIPVGWRKPAAARDQLGRGFVSEPCALPVWWSTRRLSVLRMVKKWDTSGCRSRTFWTMWVIIVLRTTSSYLFSKTKTKKN